MRTPVYAVFKSKAEWDAFVQAMAATQPGATAAPAALPGVKWQQEIVLAAFLGELPGDGTGVAITQVRLTPEGLVATVARTQAGETPVQSVTTPFHIVAVRRAGLPNQTIEVVFKNPKGNVLGRDTLAVGVRPGETEAR